MANLPLRKELVVTSLPSENGPWHVLFFKSFLALSETKSIDPGQI